MHLPAHPAHHFATRLVWTGGEAGVPFDYESYSREARLEIAGKPPLSLSASPAFKGDGALHNPEDLLVAALTGCHFLSYAAFCARSKITLVSYEDDATGTMEQKDGKMRFTEVVLRPRVVIAAGGDLEKAKALHERAHEACFIASSVNFPVRHEAVVSFG